MKFIITGRIKPYVRMTQRGKWFRPEAQEYLASQADVALQLRCQMVHAGWDMLPVKTPLAVSIQFQIPNDYHHMDLDNLIKAVQDAANGIVYADDRWIDSIQATREGGEEYVTTFEVEVL